MVNNKKILAIILARSGSSRLKNKVLLKINKSTILDIFIKRLTNCKNIDKIILATSKNQNDKKIIKIAKKNKINFYVGDEQDVLGRVLARIWIDAEFRDAFKTHPQKTLEFHGIFLPEEMTLEFQKPNSDRPRIVVYEQRPNSRFKLRVLYLQLVMMAGR